MVSPEDCGSSMGVEKATIVFSQHNSTWDEVFVQLIDNEASNTTVRMRYEPRLKRRSCLPLIVKRLTCDFIASVKLSRSQLSTGVRTEVE